MISPYYITLECSDFPVQPRASDSTSFKQLTVTVKQPPRMQSTVGLSLPRGRPWPATGRLTFFALEKSLSTQLGKILLLYQDLELAITLDLGHRRSMGSWRLKEGFHWADGCRFTGVWAAAFVKLMLPKLPQTLHLPSSLPGELRLKGGR